jgi:hypothetical protein
LNLAEQHTALEELAPAVRDYLMFLITSPTHWQKLCELAHDRMTDNYHQYLDRGWKMSPRELLREANEEVADYIVYTAMAMFGEEKE